MHVIDNIDEAQQAQLQIFTFLPYIRQCTHSYLLKVLFSYYI